ncbi:hypothetical protein K2173_009791 [Erythroxylum novogranatense]|uniref:Ribosomal RNA small subunit methyltransferase NEP1 n=1 Tax=Erythroxylum novogranatense TaxID=1862640 RepID=A0AAV8TTF6_9ROSI|nr:hypothetical protein K2173_009791 [Erythroxylum novogranatense]
MGPRYGVKGYKRKKKEKKYDKEDDEVDEQVEEERTNKKTKSEVQEEEEITNKKTKTGVEEEEAEETGKEGQFEVHEMEGIPIVPCDTNSRKPGVIFVLEKASLEVAKVGKSYQILNSEDHANFLGKNKRNPAEYRPDIVHQALLSILDSPVNKAGRLRAVYVKTEKGVLFEVKPHVRIPRTYKRFAGIILQLLQKLSIRAVGKNEKLMNVIKNPVTKYLPLNSCKIGFSYSSNKLIKMGNYLSTIDEDKDLVFVVGAMAHGKIDCDYIEDFIAISEYPLSAAWCIARICEGLANKWSIL